MAENKVTEELLRLFEKLSREEWFLLVNSSYRVRDILSNIVSWEEEYAASLADSWATKKPPWFLNSNKNSIDEFNKKSIKRYINYKPIELIERWKYLMKVFESEIKQIGIDRIRAKPNLFSWVFDEDYYLENLNTIKKVISKIIISE